MSLLRRGLIPVVVSATVLSFIAAVTQPVAAQPTSGDDTPVLLTPKGEHEDGSDEQSFDKLLDAYYETRLLAGDNKLSVTQAAQYRAQGQVTASTVPNATTKGIDRGGSWTNVGPDPIVQVGRTSNTFEAVSGRIGALAIRSDGTIILGAAQGGVWTYDANSGTWTSRTRDIDTQAVGAIAIAPSNENWVYLGTGEGALSGDSYYGNGIYLSKNGGQSWIHASSEFAGQAVSDIVVDPTNFHHLYAATLRGRGGDRRTTAPTSQRYGIYESKNSGQDWTLLKGTTDEFHGATDLVMDPTNPKVLWASFWGDKIYRSVDGGKHWASAMGDLPAGDFVDGGTRFSLGLSHPASDASATVYTGFDYFDTNGTYHNSSIWKSTDNGVHWTHLPTGSGINSVFDYCGTQCFYDNEVKPDPTNANVLYVEGSYGYNFSPASGGIFRSTDGGQTWTNLGYDLHPDFHAIAFQPNNTQHIAIGNDGGVWQTFTGGGRNNPGDPLSAADWQDLNGQVNPNTAGLIHSTGLVISQFTSISTVPQVPGQYWGGTQDNGTLRKSLANNRWFDQASGDGGQVLIDKSTVNPVNPSVPAYVFGTYYGISPYRYNPSEANTFFGNEAIDGGIDMHDRAEFYVPWIQNPDDVNQMFLGTYRLYRSDNVEAPSAGDVNFTPISGDLTTGCTGAAPNGARGCLISAIGLAQGGTGVYVGTDDGVVSVSQDAMSTDSPAWTRVGQATLPNRPVTQFAVDRSNWRIAYAAYAGFNAATPNRHGHVYMTTDGGAHWKNTSGNLPDVPVNSLLVDPSNDKILYAGTDVGAFVSTNGGGAWQRLGVGMPYVAVWQLDYDSANGVLIAGTHGRGAYTMQNRNALPALVVSKKDDGTPVGPGSNVNYTVTVKNIGNADATGVTVKDPKPANTNAVSVGDGGAFVNGVATWTGKTVPAGGSLDLHFTVQISPSLPASVHSIVNDGITVTSAQGVPASGSPHVTPIAAPHAMTLTPAAQTGGGHVGADATYTETVKNGGYLADSYDLSTGGSWTTTAYDASCTTPITSTGTVAPGASVNVCVKVAVPASAADASTSDSTVTATSSTDASVTASATLTTIAVAVDTLLVDEDGAAPNVESYYKAALTANGQSYSYWDLSANPVLPPTYLTAFKNVVWFTGNSYPAPITPYESELKTFLDGGGRLMMSGQDILDQAAGTTAFVHDYLHIAWDGTEAQNDKATSAVHGVAGNPVTDGIGAVPLDHSVLNAAFEDQVTPIGPAVSAFTDDSTATDALSVADGAYKVVFLAFPFEAYGSGTDKTDLMHRVLTYFGP